MPDTSPENAAHRHLPPPEEVVAAVLPTFMLQPSGPRGESGAVALDGWWHVYDHDPRYRYVGRVAHVIVAGSFGEKTLCGRVWNLNRRDGDGYRKCTECLRRTEKARCLTPQ